MFLIGHPERGGHDYQHHLTAQKEKLNLVSLTDILPFFSPRQMRAFLASAVFPDHELPIVVFDLLKEGNIKRAVLGENIGTTVH